ncbi:MAG: acyl--CoA ligase [Alphaproteobacteria bacterium]|nr:acyl--CoA ligase [Alphaproteobacteria bacterium]MBU1562489.1 acyl--CoA ligase [Alphaproteobacteria bacterium]MBU2304046.1 acyl--CoA ligase [Alphaproteobacteria bacterium]MBU2369108.1 acyl--CoA ligase [Alphaproteobacteria bacterium]
MTGDEEGRLLHRILANAADGGERPAISCEGESVSWAELAPRVLDLAGAIAAAPGDGDRPIGLIGLNSLDLVIAYLAIIAAGRCAVPLPVSATAETVTGMIDDCDPALVFADAAGLALIGDRAAGRVIALEPQAGGAVALGDFLARGTRLAAPVDVGGSTDFNIIYSSGTTARPKGIVHSHAMRYRQATRGVFRIGPASTMLLATPFYSNTTIMPLLATLVHGGHVVLIRKFSASAYLALAVQHGATHTMLVPVQYQRILAEPDFDAHDLSAFVLKQCTGAPLTAGLKQAVIARWPGGLFEIYGLTEGGCTCILDVATWPDKAHTVGRPGTNNDIRIIDEAGNLLPVGQAGEVVGRSPAMMSRYFRNPTATEAFYWRDAAGEVFHRTGDIGAFDKDGFLVLLDRKKDMIISGGFNIYATDLERTLLDHPEVEDAAVIAVPSAQWGETPLGLVVMRPGSATDGPALLEWANGRVGKLQRLSAIELRPTLPRSPAGKLLKPELKKPYWDTARAG